MTVAVESTDACAREGCAKPVPDAARREGDPYCSSVCFRAHHGIELPDSSPGLKPKPGPPAPTVLQRARERKSEEARRHVQVRARLEDRKLREFGRQFERDAR